MGKVAKLVRVMITTRIIVDDNASEEEIMEIALPRLLDNLYTIVDNAFENIEEIVDDTELPYDPDMDDVLT
jgi:hypothetical protein